MQRRSIALALWGLAGISFVGLASANTPLLSAIPGAMWFSMTMYGLASIGVKYAIIGPEKLWWVAQKAAGFGLLAPLVSRFNMMDLENENRKKILTYLEENPGASIQDVRVAVDVAWGTAVYHLDRLRKDGRVVSHKQGNHHRYWRSGTQEARVRRGWAVLEQPRARDIAMAVASSPGVHQGAICEALDVRAPSASKHLSRLERHGLVEKHRISRYTVYQPTEELERILAMQTASQATAAADEAPEPARAPLEG